MRTGTVDRRFLRKITTLSLGEIVEISLQTRTLEQVRKKVNISEPLFLIITKPQPQQV